MEGCGKPPPVNRIFVEAFPHGRRGHHGSIMGQKPAHDKLHVVWLSWGDAVGHQKERDFGGGWWGFEVKKEERDPHKGIVCIQLDENDKYMHSYSREKMTLMKY
jgi:hypothetical protein